MGEIGGPAQQDEPVLRRVAVRPRVGDRDEAVRRA